MRSQTSLPWVAANSPYRCGVVRKRVVPPSFVRISVRSSNPNPDGEFNQPSGRLILLGPVHRGGLGCTLIIADHFNESQQECSPIVIDMAECSASFRNIVSPEINGL